MVTKYLLISGITRFRNYSFQALLVSGITRFRNSEFSDSVLVFVRWIIWHQAKGYNWNIMSQILSFLTHITALAVGSITSSHSKISAICWYHFFVWGVIWHHGGYYCYIISQMNTYIINKILCLAQLTACRHLWQLHLVVLKFIQRNDTSRWR